LWQPKQDFMSIEETIRQIVTAEIQKQNKGHILSVSEFCKVNKISRVTLWRAEKEGKLKIARIGKRIFIDTNQLLYPV